MTTDTAVHNIERYVLMLEDGRTTKAARRRYLASLGHIKEVANYMHYGHYTEWGRREDMFKRDEAENGIDVTPFSEVIKGVKHGKAFDT